MRCLRQLASVTSFVMQNLVFLYAVVFVLLNILVDLTIAWLDPRIRYR